MTEDADPTRKVGTPGNVAIESAPQQVGNRLGRYSILEAIGQGGMGTVVRAYDPKLRREVALKRVRTDVLDDQAEARLIREAQAMAQLTHPNVVAVYDVDVIGDEMVLAMEYVPGQTLRTWFRDKPAWQDVIDTMLAAGRGLAAAHAAGLIHRDFKPANVLLGDDESVKVTDFGLAKVLAPRMDGTKPPARTDPCDSGELGQTGSRGTADDLAPSMTNSFLVIGTPRYMSPEQHAGASPGAPTDQYAFCVTLWEGLCGKPPFSATQGLERAKRDGPPVWPVDIVVPRQLADAVRRGLSLDPQDRWPSMEALLAALDATRRSGSRRRWIAAGIGLATLISVPIVAGRGSSAQVCTGAGPQIDGVWGAKQRTSVQHALLATEVTYARSTSDRVLARFDDYADRWAAMHTETCEATQLRREQSEEVMDLRMACLDRAKRSLHATVRVLSDADAAMMDKAIDITHGLPSLARCEDVAALQASVPPPDNPQLAEAVKEAEGRLAEAHARIDAGQFEDAATILDAFRSSSPELSYVPLRAAVEIARGELMFLRHEDGEPGLREGVRLAVESGDLLLAVPALSKIAEQIGRFHHHSEEARWLADLAVSLAHGHAPDTEIELDALINRAWVGFIASPHVRPLPLEDVERALDMAERLPEPNENAVLSATYTYAAFLGDNGHYDKALDLQAQILEASRASHGDDHPKVYQALGALTVTSWEAGRIEDALEFGERALEMKERLCEGDCFDLGGPLTNLAGISVDMGRYDEAERILMRLEPIEDGIRKLSPDMNDEIRRHRAELYSVTGRHTDAEALARARLAEAQDGGASEDMVHHRAVSLADALRAADRYEDALALYRPALAFFEQQDTRTSTRLDVVSGTGITYLRLGRVDKARPLLERAAASDQAHRRPRRRRAETALALADLLDHVGEHEAATEHARTAQRLYESLGPAHATDVQRARTLAK